MSLGVRGHSVAQLVDILLYNSEFGGSILDSLRPQYSTGFDSDSRKNCVPEYLVEDKNGRCLGLTNLPPLCADCLENWEPNHPATMWDCPGLYRDCYNFAFVSNVVDCAQTVACMQ